MSGRLDKKVAIITGAGSGIGAETAEVFAAEGAAVIVSDVDEQRAAQVAERIRGRGGVAQAKRADVSAPADVAELMRFTSDTFGGLDILHNNAGIPMPVTPLADVDLADFDRIMAVNLRGVFICCQAAVGLLRSRGGGAIVNTSALSGLKARPGLSVYSASKGGVNMLTKALALELAPDRIRVNSVCPVATDTPMLGAFRIEGDAEIDRRDWFARAIPLGRLATPHDIAMAVVYLASDESAAVTGVMLPVDGGSLA